MEIRQWFKKKAKACRFTGRPRRISVAPCRILSTGFLARGIVDGQWVSMDSEGLGESLLVVVLVGAQWLQGHVSFVDSACSG